MTHEPCASRGDCYHARAGRIGGRIAGRKNVESGHLARIRELPQTKAARRENGRKAVESGHLARINELPQTKAAQRENGRWLGHKYGRKNGRKAVESGHLDRIRELPQAKAAQRESGRWLGRKYGRKYGRKNVESGHLARINELSQTKAAQRENGRWLGRKAVESGQLARNSKGVASTADGIPFRSQTEAMCYCVLKASGGEPKYEPGFIKLPDGTSYMPDFILGKPIPVLGLPAGVPIELKPSRNAYYLKNVEKALRAGAVVVYWDELVEENF